ncbi:MAG: SDR family NAD(P)-dependent oxidoreductase, partial [Nostoc sp.]
MMAFCVKAAGVEVNLAESEMPKKLFDHIEGSLGQVDILINNAAHDQQADIYSLSSELLDTHYTVNIRGTTLLCGEFANRHDGRPGGRIINLTSGQSLAPMATFQAFWQDLLGYLKKCSSGKELIEKGFESDVELSAAYNISDCVPLFTDNAYINYR